MKNVTRFLRGAIITYTGLDGIRYKARWDSGFPPFLDVRRLDGRLLRHPTTGRRVKAYQPILGSLEAAAFFNNTANDPKAALSWGVGS